MSMILANILKKSTVASVLLSGLFLLTACGGGGGGGGGGGLPEKVVVEFPAKDSTVTDSSADFEISFVSGVTDTSSLAIILNTIDVTSLFTPTTGTTNRKASIYSLSGFLKEGSGNCLTVTMDGSKNSGACFSYDAKPEVILTSLTGEGPFTANGVTRKATLASVTLNTILAEVVTTPIPTANAFARAFDTMPTVRSNITTIADFSIVATDADATSPDTLTTEYIMPRAHLKTGAAVQFNNTAFDVVEKWVGEIMENKLNEVFVDFVADPLPYANTADLTVSGYNAAATPALLDYEEIGVGNTACQLLNFRRLTGQGYSQCKLYVSDITSLGTVITNVTMIDSGSSSDDTVSMQVKVTFSQLRITLDTAAFLSDVYDGGFIVPLIFNNAEFTLKVDISKGTGIVAFAVDETTPFAINLDVSNPVVGESFCSICQKPMDPTLINAAISTIENQIVAEATGFVTDINDALANANVDNTTVSVAVKDAEDTTVSSLNFLFTGSDVTESKSSNVVVGGFVGIGGSTYADDDSYGDANDLPALGSSFDPLNATIISTKLMHASNAVMMAFSENSLNQLLLSVYQSKLFATQSVELKVRDLGVDADENTIGDLGDAIIALTAGTSRIVDADDFVTIDFDLRAIPTSSFVTGASPAVELRLNAVNVVVKLYRNCGLDVASCTPLYSSVFNLDTKMLMGLGLLNGLPDITIDDIGISIIGDVTNTFLNPLLPDTGVNAVTNTAIRNEVTKQINKSSLSVLMPSILSAYVADFTTALLEPSTSDLDIIGLGLVDKSAWIVLQALSVDAQSEFIVLTATIVDVEPTLPTQGIFRLNITDSSAITPP
jgi:hypothetical protein